MCSSKKTLRSKQATDRLIFDCLLWFRKRQQSSEELTEKNWSFWEECLCDQMLISLFNWTWQGKARKWTQLIQRLVERNDRAACYIRCCQLQFKKQFLCEAKKYFRRTYLFAQIFFFAIFHYCGFSVSFFLCFPTTFMTVCLPKNSRFQASFGQSLSEVKFCLMATNKTTKFWGTYRKKLEFLRRVFVWSNAY